MAGLADLSDEELLALRGQGKQSNNVLRPPWATQKEPSSQSGDLSSLPDEQLLALRNRPNMAAFESKPPETTAGQAFGRGIGNAVTFNFYDELAGLMRSGGVDPNDPDIAHAVKGLAVGAYKKIKGGDQEADKLYNEQVANTRAETKQLESEHPWASLGGQATGAVLLPGLGAARGATMAGRMGAGALVGAGTGAAYGLGEGESPEERLSKAGTGAAVGGVVGGLAPPVAAGITAGVGRITSPIKNIIQGAIRPETEASRRVASAIRKDIDAGAGGLSAQEFHAAQQAGTPVANMDIGGEATRALARSAANTSPVGRAALEQTINDRFESQGPRISSWLQDTFHYPNASAQQAALEETARTVNNSLYTKAREAGSQGLWSPELERLAGSSAVNKAMKTAVENSKDEAIVKGYGAANPKITFTSDGQIQFNRGPTGVPTYPDLQYWDQVRRELSDAAHRAGYGTEESRRLGSFAKSLNAELDNLVPEYATARKTAAGFFGAQDALEAGKSFVGGGHRFKTDEVRTALASMSPTERQLFQDGYVSRLIEKMDAVGDRRTILNQIAQSPAAREELNLALGRQRATELEGRLRIEGIMDLARKAVQNQSTTVRQLAEMGLAGGAVGSYEGYQHGGAAGIGAAIMTGALLHGKNKVNENLARRVGEMLASSDPTVMRRGVQYITRSQRMMDALRSFDTRFAAIAGQQAGSQ